MKIKLNGWQRLWVLLCILYFILVVGVTISTFPNPSDVANEEIFEKQLSQKSRSMLAMPDAKGTIWDDQVGFDVKMPNGYILRFKKGQKENEVQNAAHEYYELLEHQANKNIFVHIMLALFWWAFPSTSFYILGWSIGWVYRGFKKTP